MCQILDEESCSSDGRPKLTPEHSTNQQIPSSSIDDIRGDPGPVWFSGARRRLGEFHVKQLQDPHGKKLPVSSSIDEIRVHMVRRRRRRSRVSDPCAVGGASKSLKTSMSAGGDPSVWFRGVEKLGTKQAPSSEAGGLLFG